MNTIDHTLFKTPDQPVTGTSTTTQPLTIGPWKIQFLNCGNFALDGGAMFGIIPKTLWSKLIKPDELNRITLATRVLLLSGHVNGQAKNILIDCGMGFKWTAKEKNIYAIDTTATSFDEILKTVALSRQQITDLVLTHLHFDHCGGATYTPNTLQTEQNNPSQNQLALTFPNAQVWVQKGNWEHALHPTERDAGSYLRPNFDIFADQPRQFNLLSGNETIYPGLQMLVYHGHTYHQQLPFIFDEQQGLIYGADIVPTSHHLKLPYVMGYDLQPALTVENKKDVYRMLQAKQQGYLVFEHDPLMPYVQTITGGGAKLSTS